ncbi:ATP-binding protein [Chloroflexota bacterium]
MARSMISSEMLSKIIDGSPIASFVINKQHKVVHWNIAIEALTGIKREDIIGTDHQWKAFYIEKRPVMADLIVDGASAAEVEEYYQGMFKKSTLINGAYEADDIFPDLGIDKKWLHFTASPIRSDSAEIIGAIETLEDITERKSAEESLRNYLREITRAQEAERKRIARELHDDTAQVLGSLSRQLDEFIRKHRLAPDETLILKDLQAQLNQGVQSVQSFSQALRLSVLDDLGLIPALRSLARRLEESDGIDAILRVTGKERRFSPEVELMLFRIVQEALNNTRKHARSTSALVIVAFAEDITRVTISDNGQGFKLPGRFDDFTRLGKLGLTGMQERVQLLRGTLEVKSAPSDGTTVTVEVPSHVSLDSFPC